MATLKLSAEGVRSLERELESLEEKLRQNRIYKNQIAVDNGNVWHDNNDFEQCEIEERRLTKEITDLKNKLRTVEIISSDNSKSQDVVNYGAIVKLRITEDGIPDDLTILFSDSDEKSEYIKISLNSPVGKVIYMQKVGFTDTYTIEGDALTVEILDITY